MTTPSGDKGVLKRLIANKLYRRLWLGQFVSGIGDWLIIGLLIPTVTALSGGSSIAIAGILVAKIIPSLFFSSFTGALVDHFDRRKVMIVSDLVRLVLVLFLISTRSLFAIYAVVLLMETASLFFWPARTALVPYLVKGEDFKMANGLMYTTQQGAMIIGLAASGAILAGFERVVHLLLSGPLPVVLQPFVASITPILVGSRAGYVLDSFTFIFSAVMTLSMGKIDARAPQTNTRMNLARIAGDAFESFRFVGRKRELRGVLVTIFLAILGGGAIVPVGLDFINRLGGAIPFANRVEWIAKFSGSRQTFVMLFLAVGMGVGALVVPRLEQKLPVRKLFPISALVFGTGMLAFSTVSSYFTACLFAVGAGVCIAGLSVAAENYIVQEVADEIRGRVFSVRDSVVKIALLISMTVTAPLNDAISALVRAYDVRNGVVAIGAFVLSGPRITLILCGLIVVGAGIFGYWELNLNRRALAAPIQKG